MDATKILNTVRIKADDIIRSGIFQNYFDEIKKELDELIKHGNGWVKIENKALYYEDSESILLADTFRWECGDKEYKLDMDGVGPGKMLNEQLAKKLFVDNKKTNPLIISNNTVIANCKQGTKYYVAFMSKNGSEKCYTLSGNTYNYRFNDRDTMKIPYLPLKSDKLIAFIENGLIPSGTKYEDKYKLFIELFKSGSLKISGSDVTFSANEVKDNDTLAEMAAEAVSGILLKSDKIRADIEEYDPTVLTDIGVGHWELWDNDKKDGISFKPAQAMIARDPLADILDDGLIGIDFGTRSTVVGYQNGSENIHLLRIGKGDLRQADPADYENPTIIEFDNIESFMEAYRSSEGRPLTSWEDIKVSHSANENFKNTNLNKKDSENFYSFMYELKQWCGKVNQSSVTKLKSMNTGKEYTLPKYIDLKEDDFDPIEIYAYYLGLFINNMRNKIFLRYIMSFPVNYEQRVRNKILSSFRKGIMRSLPQRVLDSKEAMQNFSVTEGSAEPASYAVCALQEYQCEPINDSAVLYGVFDFGGGTTDFDYGIWRYADDSVKEERYDFVIEHFGAAGSQYLGGENLLELLAFEIFKANRKKLLKEKITFTKPVYMDDFDEKEALIANTQIARRNTKQLAEALRPFLENSLKEISEIIDDADGSTEEAAEEILDEASLPEDINKVNEYISRKYPSGISRTDCMREIKNLKSQLKLKSPASLIFKSIKHLVTDYDISSNEKFRVFKITSDFEPLKSGSINVGLLDTDGKYKENTVLIINNEDIKVDLMQILKDKIEEGIRNFFYAFNQAISSPQFKQRNIKVSSICIFLAGNASRSPIVKNGFCKYINESFRDFCSNFKIDPNKDLHLMPPLGTAEADRIMESHGKDVDAGSLTRPTGKTGVVYGLIQSRMGGTILVKDSNKQDDEIPFRYFVGLKKRSCFRNMLSKDTGYNKWVRLINAQINEFEIYYTSLPAAKNGDLSISDPYIRKKNLRISKTSDKDDVSIYIRAVRPEVIEYCVAEESGLNNNLFIAEPVKVELI